MPSRKHASCNSSKLAGMENGSFCTLCRRFAIQSSAHGLRRAATARSSYTRIFWVTVFLLALIGCTFHCSFLVKTYLSYPRMTITEEIHADEITFPSITVCNLNVFKKSYIDKQFEILRKLTQTFNFNATFNPNDIDPTAFCYKSIDEFLYRSKTVDLSDIWMSLTVTKDSLQKFGHQEEDLIIHCTYNARNCYNDTHTIVLINAYPSPRYGLCHTISVNQTSLQNVTRPGLALGLRLTLNIQREEYLDLLSPEYGARLLVHAPGTYPTLQRGGVVLQPGTKTYVSVRMMNGAYLLIDTEVQNVSFYTMGTNMVQYCLSANYRASLASCQFQVESSEGMLAFTRGKILMCGQFKTTRKIDRLPWPYGECTDEFEQSPLSSHLRRTGQRDLLKHRIYTYEYCQTLCRDAFLLKQCDCSEEVSQGNSRFCDPCNITQALCRTNFLRRFNRNHRSRECHKFCKPACSDIRYDLTISRSEWPNKRHHFFLLKRWPQSREKFGPAAAAGNYSGHGEGPVAIDLGHLRSNFLRVHVFIQEMNFLSVKDVPAYSTSQLFADLGGCLGLYIGVSLITILEVFELFKSIFFIIRSKIQVKMKPNSAHQNGVVELRWVASPPNRPFPVLYRRDKKCCPRISVTQGSSNRNTASLNPRCVSPLRQLPSPIFMKDINNYPTIQTAYSSY